MNYTKLIKQLSPVELLEYFRTIPQREISEAAFQVSCKRIARKFPVKLSQVSCILDNSIAMIGHGDNKYHPISIAESIASILFHSSVFNITFGTPNKVIFLSELKGTADIPGALKEAFKIKPSHIFIITPSFDSNILSPYIKRIKRRKVRIIHLDPFHRNPFEEESEISDLTDTYNIRSSSQFSFLPLTLKLKSLKKEKLDKIIKYIREDELNNLPPAIRKEIDKKRI